MVSDAQITSCRLIFRNNSRSFTEISGVVEMQQARTAPHPADKSGSPPVTVSPGGARDVGHSPGEAPPRAEGGAAAAA